MSDENQAIRPRAALAAACVLSLLVALPGLARSEDESSWSGEARDAWLDGRIEAAFALNEHLDPFDIGTRVESGEVTLSGSVESQIDKDLAAEIARSVDGVEDVNNELTVEPETSKAKQRASGRSFADRVGDATTTARVKTALLANQSTSGLDIDVDTRGGVVALRGEVRSEQEGDLAERIAANTEGVKRVENQLEAAEAGAGS